MGGSCFELNPKSNFWLPPLTELAKSGASIRPRGLCYQESPRRQSLTLIYFLATCGVIWLLWHVSHRRQTPTKSQPVKISNPRITIRLESTTSPYPEQTEAELDRDNWEGSFGEVKEPFPVKAALLLKYEDGLGKKTERIVEVREVGAYLNTQLIIGHCRVRGATRTFRTDRIKECVDIETGGVVSDVYAYLRQKYEESPEFSLDKLLKHEYDSLRVLLYVSKADGFLRSGERLIVRDACQRLAVDPRIDEAATRRLLASLQVPSLQAFRLAVGRLTAKPEPERLRLIEFAERIVATDKTVHPAEKEAIDYLKKRLCVHDADRIAAPSTS